MQNTTNYNLNKPDGTDFAKIEFLNENADIVDEKLKELENGLNNIDFSSVNQAISNVDSQLTTHANNQQLHVTQDKQTYWDNFLLRNGGTLTGAADFNSLQPNHIYQVAGVTGGTGTPPESYGTLIYFRVPNTDYGYQEITGVTGQTKYFRATSSGAWQPWRKILNQNDYDTLFQSVSNGKAAIADAITQKGVATSATAEFATMAANISNISQRPKTASGTTTSTANGAVQINGLGFTPTYVRLITTHAGGVATYHFYYPLFGTPTTNSNGFTVYPVYGSGDSITTDQTLSGMYQGGFHLPSGVTNASSVQWLASDGILF